MGVAKEGRTAVRIAGEGEEQTPLEGQEVPLDYLFEPGIRRERPHRTCRTSQTSAHPSQFDLSCLIWTRVFSFASPARVTGVRTELSLKLHDKNYKRVSLQ